MHDRRLWLLISMGCLVGVGTAAYVAYQGSQADAWVDQARARLDAPLREAPSLDRIQASTALSLLERAREAGREGGEFDALLHYARSLDYFQRGDLVFAQRELDSARRYGGVRAAFGVLEAEIARRRTDLGRAKESLSAVLEREPAHPRARLVRAEIALDEGDGRAALTLLNALGAEHPQVGLVHARLGVARESVGDVAGAEAAYRRAIRLNERDVSSWINLGRLAHASEEYAQAIGAYERALAVEAEEPDALLGRGLARAASGEAEAASEDYRAAAEGAPNDAEPLLALGDLLRDLERVPEAIVVYREALEREASDAASWLKLGNALVLAGEHAEAIPVFREAIDRAPTLAAAHNGLGAALMRTGALDPARVALRRASELDPGDSSPLLNLGLLEERADQPEAARAAWRAVLELRPDHPLALTRLAGLGGQSR